MNEVTAMRVFIEVARRKSFVRASEHFNISPAAASKYVSWLERTLGARLLNRTTKQMSLTPAGEQVIESANDVLRGIEDMKQAVKGLSSGLDGVVKVGIAPYFGAHRFVPIVAAFCKQYPDIQVAISILSRQRIDAFVSEGLDFGIVSSPTLPDASHVAYMLGRLPQVIVAAPSYLRHNEPVKRAQDLAQHDCLINVYKSSTGTWRFESDDGPITVRVKGPLRSNIGEILKQAAVEGMGISIHPLYMVADELKSGKLEMVLADAHPELLHIHAIYSKQESVPQRARAFLEFMKCWIQEHPEWPAN